MKQKRFSLLFLCFLLCFTCSCAASPAQEQSVPQANSALPQASPSLGLRLITSTHGLFLSAGADTDEGFYEIVGLASDGISRLTYYDYATRQRVCLSSDASAPMDETNTAYLGNDFGGMSCFADERYLYVYKRGNQLLASEDFDKGRPYFLRMDLNGANRTRLNLPVTQEPGLSSGIVRDKNGALYLTTYYIDNTQPIDEMEKCIIVKLDFDKQTVTPLATIPGSKTEMRIREAYGDALLIERIDSNLDAHDQVVKRDQLRTERTLLLYDVPTGEEELLFSFDNTKIQKSSVMPYQGRLYYMKPNDKALYAYSLDTRREETVFPYIGPRDEDCTLRIYDEIRDGKMQFLAEYPDGVSRVLAVDLATGETFEPSLTAQLDDGPMFVGIFAESPAYFFVYCDKSSFSVTAYGNDGRPFTTQQGYMVFKLIKKDDYWHSRPNYIDFEDHVLPL